MVNPSLCEPFHKLLGVQRSEDVVRELEQLARAVYPYEAGAIIRPDGLIMPVDNIAEEPKEDFELPCADYHLLKPGCIFWHSHPKGPNHPSFDDQKSQLHGNNGWAITARDPETETWDFFCWGDQLQPPSLVGRSFRHYVTDCFSVIRHEFKTRGLHVPDCPRPKQWWKQDGIGHTILDHLQRLDCPVHYEADFRPQPGDVALMQVRSRTVNHLAVLTEGFEFLHHLEERLSAREPAEEYMHYVRGWLRYAGA